MSESNPWDDVYNRYPTSDKVNRFRIPRPIITMNVILGKDLSGRNPEEISYCSCKKCQPMKQPVEAFCCKEISSATTSWSKNFKKFMAGGCICDDANIVAVVENKVELEIFINTVKGLSNPDSEDVELMDRNYRFALYKKLTIMIHGFVGVKQRLPLPSCLVSFVRNVYSEDDEEDYCGFIDAS